MTMPGEKEELKDFLDDTFKTMDGVLADQHPELTQREVGLVHYVGYGIVRVSGLPNIRAEEIVLFPKNVQGLVFNIDPEEIGVILLGASEHLNSGSEVRRTGRRRLWEASWRHCNVLTYFRSVYCGFFIKL